MKNYENSKKVKLIALAAMIATLICAVLISLTYIFITNNDTSPSVENAATIEAPELEAKSTFESYLSVPSLTSVVGTQDGKNLQYYIVDEDSVDPQMYIYMTDNNTTATVTMSFSSMIDSSIKSGVSFVVEREVSPSFDLPNGYGWMELGNNAEINWHYYLVKNLSNSSIFVTPPPPQTYTGSALTPKPTLKDGNVTIYENSNYTLSYKNNTSVGTATVTIEAIEQGPAANPERCYYRGSISTTFTISPASLNLGLSYSTVTYGSNSSAPTVTGNTGNGTKTFSVTNGTGKATINASTGVLTPTQAGTVTVTVNVAATSNYPAGSKSTTVTINKANVSLGLSYPTVTYGASPVSPTVTGNAGGGTVSYTATNGTGGASVNPTTGVLTPTKIGTVTVTVKSAATTNYNAGSKSVTVTIGKANISPSITSAASVTYGSTLALTCSGNSGNGAATWSVTNGTGKATVSGSTLTATQAGTVTVKVSIAATTNYNAGSATKTITINKANISPSITSAASVTYGNTLSLTCSGNSGNGTVTWSVAAGTGKATISGSTLTPTQAGTVTVTLSIAATTNYNAGSATKTVTIGKANISPSITSAASVTYGSTLALTCSGNSGNGTVTWSVAAGTGKATISGSTLTPTQAGTVTVTLSIAATTNYNAGSATKTVTIGKANISPSITSAASVTYGSSLSLTCSGNSGNGTVTWSVAAGTGKATISGSTLTPTQAGTVTVTLSIAATTNYNAGSATKTITIGKATISPSLSYGTVVYGTNASPTLSGNTGSGSVTWKSSDTGVATISSSGVVTPVKVGSTTITATIAETTNYKGGTATATVTVQRKAIAIPTLAKGTGAGGSVSNQTATTTYTGSAQHFTISSTSNITFGTPTTGATRSGTDFYATNAGTYTVSMTIDSNKYCWGSSNGGTDTADKTLTIIINARNISNATFGTIDTQYYNKGAAITPTPTITDTNISKTLVDGTDFTFSYSDNINAGTATITVTGKGNYTGAKSTTFTISGSLLSNATIGEITSQTYDGTEKKPTATVTLDGVTLSSGTDFTFGWSNNVNAGTATLTITGKGNYAGTNSKTFEISARSISNATAAEIAAQGYTASAKTPLPALTDLSRTLTKDTDYTLEYADNVNVGTAKITITGKGNYNGTKEVTFTITARNISGATVPAIPAQTYTGSAIEPLPEVTDLSITLVRGTDFTVTYKDNVNVGTATLILTGMGNYTGTKEIVFSIQPPTVADATVTISETSFTYDGSAKEPRVTLVQIGGLTLRAGADFTVSYSANVNAGTAKVIVTGAGDYVGTKEVTFTINPADIANATLNGLQLTYVYTGSAISPEVTVTMDGVTLILNTDYLITYSDNISVGTATVTVAGSKNYTGTLTDTFAVIKADISPATVTGIEGNYEYTGNAIAPEPTVTWSGATLVKDTDYTVSFADNTALGTATVTIAGIGNFSGTITKTFEIVQADISTAEISGVDASYDFTGSEITPEPTVTFNGVTLVKDTDYTVGYADNVNTGTATVTVTGCGNYTGVITKNFVIGEADMDGVTVTGIDPTYEYTGSAIAPEPTVTYNGITLVKDADYTVAYSDNIGLGVVTVTITGCGNFNSVTTATFEIVQANIANATVTGVNESYEYTGSAITPEPVVTLNGVTLEKNVDYTVSYVNNTVTGTAVVNLTGTGNYKGINSAVFNIVRADVSDAEVTGIAETYQWTGSEIIPAPTVVLNGVTLVQNTDYVVICDGNVEVGTVTYTITAVGYYTGSIGGTFEIVKATPQVEVTYTDYNGINTLFVGDALPAITATATYNGATVSGIVSWDTDGGVAPALKDGENDYNWTFTPDDTDHYEVVTGNKTLTAEEPTYADIRVEWKDGAQPELFTSSSVSVILKNLKVTGIFNNGTENEIIGSFTFVGSWDTSGAESTAAMPATGGGNYYITVKFGRHSKPVYDIRIDDVVLEELVYSAADGGEIKTDYTALDGFDTASVKVTAKYNDGSEKVLPSGSKGYTVAYENGADSLQFGDTKVTLSYTEAGVTETVEIGGLTVSKKPFDDTVLTFNPADADYDFGNSVTGGVTVDNLPDWLKVTYVYEDEEGNILDPSAVRNAGTYKVTAKFTVDNNHEEIDDITATFTINKIDPVLTPAVGGSLAAGTQLSDLTFSAGNGATAGTLVWDDGAYELKEGINRCYYTFTPDDTVNFKVVHGYVDVMAEVPAPEDISGGSLVGWQIALIVVSIAVAVLALIALIVALKSRRAPVDSDGFYDDATEEDLKN